MTILAVGVFLVNLGGLVTLSVACLFLRTLSRPIHRSDVCLMTWLGGSFALSAAFALLQLT